MKWKCLTSAMFAMTFAVTLLLSACSTTPTITSLLDQTRSEYIAAQSNPKVAAYAPLEMKQASEAYAEANAASDHGASAEKVDKLADIAKQKIILAEEIAKQKSTKADFSSVPNQNNQVRWQ